MQAFLQSAFLQALAMSPLASIWQMALLWIITITLLKQIKLASAQKFNIAFIAQLSGLVLFTYTFINNYNYHEEKIANAALTGNFFFNEVKTIGFGFIDCGILEVITKLSFFSKIISSTGLITGTIVFELTTGFLTID